jgi:dTDP-4-dehydrorhamnose 3,5-epimerase
MKVLETGIEGLVQIIPAVYSDHRGQFVEFFKSSKFRDLTGGTDYLQDNISFSKKNVLRGLHLQMAPAQQAKIVTVITGKVLDVVVDLRSGSSTFGQTYQAELSSELRNQLIIPAGFAHGFSTLEDAHFLYKCSQEYDPACETGIIWNDTDLNINWQVSEPILSDKDKQLPTLRELLGKSVISR